MMMSIVIPVKNERENIAPLLSELAALAEKIPVGEVLYIDDGSTDGTLDMLKDLRAKHSFLRVISHDRSAGQSAALWTGVRAAGNDLIATLDGDGQNAPADIEMLYARYKSELPRNAPLMVAGQRMKRRDNAVRRISSRLANGIRSFALKDGTRDTGCSLKIFRRQDYLKLPYFDHMHRFLPALMARQGVAIAHVGVSHRSRAHGASKYGFWDRLWVGISDLLGVMWLQRRAYPSVVALEE
ncbi:MAG: glycosyltransferase family 2 protein [Proteobacteria bacterium]|nr:glycosyltransferase family 2 protein [Pseudomonadota bacterium]